MKSMPWQFSLRAIVVWKLRKKSESSLETGTSAKSLAGFTMKHPFKQPTACATAVDEVEAFTVSVAPNPASDMITIRANEPLSVSLRAIELTDATGRLVRRAALRASGGEVDIRELPEGLYFLRIGGGEGAIVKKVVKN